MNVLIITNNELVKNKIPEAQVVFVDGSVWDVIKKTRDMVYQNHKLLTHPLSGSLKPNQTPFKSIIISQQQPTTHFDSAIIISNTIETIKKMGYKKLEDIKDNTIKKDYMYVDYCLILSALNRLKKL